MFDALTIAAIADELSDAIVRGRIQRVQHVDHMTIAFETYGRGSRNWLTMSADSQHARLTFQPERAPTDSEIVSPLFLLLRKYARGARILAVDQPRFDRILKITIAQAQIDDDEDNDVELEIHDLILELMGRHSNLILVDERGRIRDSIKRVTPAMSRVRPILPGNQYVPPPPQDKLDPSACGPSQLIEMAEGETQRLDRWLVSTFLGLSPLLATEVLHRCGLTREINPNDLSVAQCEAVLRNVRDLYAPLDNRSWSPRVYLHDNGATFSAIPLLHLEEREDVFIQRPDTVLAAAVEALEHGSPRESRADRHAPRRERLVEEVDEARERLVRRRDNLLRQQDRTSDPDALRIKGEMIYAYLWMIEPGMTEIETPDGLHIALDPDLGANDNAQAYFEQYRKAQSAAEEIPKRLAQTDRRLAYVDQLRLSAEQSESYDEIESIRQEWQEFASTTQGVGGALKPGGSKPSKSARRPRRYDLQSGGILWVGRTGRQNDTVTFDIGSPDDIWLHARDIPGAHVILRPSPGQDAADKDIETAAALAAFYSTARSATRVPIDVTERRHVRKIRGGGPGMVNYRNEYTINVEPHSAKDLALTDNTG